MTTTASSSNITPRKIRVIGVPLDLGQSRRGVDMGPSAVRYAGLQHALERLGIVAVDRGNVAVRVVESASPEEASVWFELEDEAEDREDEADQSPDEGRDPPRRDPPRRGEGS